MPSRNNQGRPSKSPNELKKKMNFMLSPLVIAYLDSVSASTGISKSALVENCIRKQMKQNGGDPDRAAQTSRN
jgi:hypothetical protein